MMKDYQIKILMLMHELEKTLHDLYTLFSEKFPKHDDLWAVLIREEFEHAEAVRKFYQLTYERQSLFDEGAIKPEGVQSIVDYVKNVYGSALQGKFDVKQALTITHDIEKSLIARDIFSHFKVTSTFADTLQRLHDDSMNHMNLAKKELEKITKRQKK